MTTGGWGGGATLTFRLHENLPNLSSQILRVLYSKTQKGLKGDNLSNGSVQILLSPLCMILFLFGRQMGKYASKPTVTFSTEINNQLKNTDSHTLALAEDDSH